MVSASGSTELGSLTVHNLEQVKLLNSVVFPIAYSQKFYDEQLTVGEFAKMAFYEKIFVGSVCSRMEVNKDTEDKRLYVLSLGVLAPYRRRGVATKLYNHILEHAQKDSKIKEIFLHVQTTNVDALAFYKGFGFEIVETVKGYYKRIEDTDAHVLSLKL